MTICAERRVELRPAATRWRMSSSARAASDSDVSTCRRPGPRRRALRMRAATTRSALGSSRSSARPLQRGRERHAHAQPVDEHAQLRLDRGRRRVDRRGDRLLEARPRRRSCRAATPSTTPAPRSAPSDSRSALAPPNSADQRQHERRRTDGGDRPPGHDEHERGRPPPRSSPAARSARRSDGPPRAAPSPGVRAVRMQRVDEQHDAERRRPRRQDDEDVVDGVITRPASRVARHVPDGGEARRCRRSARPATATPSGPAANTSLDSTRPSMPLTSRMLATNRRSRPPCR